MPRAVLRLMSRSHHFGHVCSRLFSLARFASILLSGALGCRPDSVVPSTTADPSQLYWALTLDHHAVTLSTHAPYDTLRLLATRRTPTGAALGDTRAPSFRSNDVERLQVDSNGVLHAIETGSGIMVIAEDTTDDVVHADTAVVNVTADDPPPVLDTLSIHPIPPDGATFPLGGSLLLQSKTITARTTDAQGNPIGSLAVQYTSSDPLVATVDQDGVITTIRVGTVTFIATATAYGITRADTLPFTVEPPSFVTVSFTARVNASGQTIVAFPPSAVTIGVGGDVLWNNSTTVPVDVVFDDPTNVVQDDQFCALLGSQAPEAFCTAGNMDAWSADTVNTLLSYRMRRFQASGTYRFHSTLYGTTGMVIVE